MFEKEGMFEKIKDIEISHINGTASAAIWSNGETHFMASGVKNDFAHETMIFPCTKSGIHKGMEVFAEYDTTDIERVAFNYIRKICR